MIENILWGLTFVGLWITLVWLNFIGAKDSRPGNKRFPLVTVVVPVYNEGVRLIKTIDSLAALDYPRQKLEIIIVNDCSTDNTLQLAKQLIKKYADKKILLINKTKNAGKVSAVNTALAMANGELFSCLDADSRVAPDALKILVSRFSDEKIGAVIPIVKIDNPKNLYERIQRVEYILANFVRQLMSSIDTLFLTHGVLAVFRTNVLRKLGGFSEGGMTEDLEIAMRLKKNGYLIKTAHEAITYTCPPNNFIKLWKQRVRWYRGFIFNHWNYRSMFFKKQNSLFGRFQLPVNIIAVTLLLATVGLVSYGLIKDGLSTIIRSITIQGYFFNHVLSFPASIKQYVLSQNMQITIPIIITTIVGVYFLVLASASIKEKIARHAHIAIAYFIIMPYLTTVHWVSAIVQELARAKRKW